MSVLRLSPAEMLLYYQFLDFLVAMCGKEATSSEGDEQNRNSSCCCRAACYARLSFCSGRWSFPLIWEWHAVISSAQQRCRPLSGPASSFRWISTAIPRAHHGLHDKSFSVIHDFSTHIPVILQSFDAELHALTAFMNALIKLPHSMPLHYLPDANVLSWDLGRLFQEGEETPCVILSLTSTEASSLGLSPFTDSGRHIALLHSEQTFATKDDVFSHHDWRGPFLSRWNRALHHRQLRLPVNGGWLQRAPSR